MSKKKEKRTHKKSTSSSDPPLSPSSAANERNKFSNSGTEDPNAPGADTSLGDDYLRAFVLMPFGKKGKIPSANLQSGFFHLLIFALNDAFYQNYANQAVRSWRPIKLERADIGPDRSPDLLDNILRKIDKCHFCVVDITHDNLNVALEYGYALARDKFLIPVQRLTPDPEVEKHRNSDGDRPRISDLAGKLIHTVELARFVKSPLWNDLASAISTPHIIDTHHELFYNNKNKIHPFSTDSKATHTFLLSWLREISRAKEKSWRTIEELYREHIVRPLYKAFRPLYEKLESVGTEPEYDCTAYATREAAELSKVFGNASEVIRILTTNLDGLVRYVPDITRALQLPSLLKKLEILTLDPESEFVNARGTLIGKEIAPFRQEMKDGLGQFEEDLRKKFPTNVVIKTYSEFPTQITFFVDDDVFSAAVSVNHQSRNNIVFKVRLPRMGVAASFLQHWDTIWARAKVW